MTVEIVVLEHWADAFLVLNIKLLNCFFCDFGLNVKDFKIIFHVIVADLHKNDICRYAVLSIK